jgi:hypothetical protein
MSPDAVTVPPESVTEEPAFSALTDPLTVSDDVPVSDIVPAVCAVALPLSVSEELRSVLLPPDEVMTLPVIVKPADVPGIAAKAAAEANHKTVRAAGDLLHFCMVRLQKERPQRSGEICLT